MGETTTCMYAGGNDPVEGKECKRVGELLEHVLKQASVAGSSIGFRKVQPEAKPDLSLCFYIVFFETQQTHYLHIVYGCFL